MQLYTGRVLLLPVLDALVNAFIANVKLHLPTTAQLIALVKGNDRKSLKSKVDVQMRELRLFLDRMHALIAGGCDEDLRAIAGRGEYAAPKIEGGAAQSQQQPQQQQQRAEIWDGVRRQLEVEVYVPLRSALSMVLVNAFRIEDLEVKKKMDALSSKSQAFFNIPEKYRSPTGWASARDILRDGMGKSTLPSEKLDAVLQCAGEIVRLFREEHAPPSSSSSSSQQQQQPRSSSSEGGGSWDSAASSDDEQGPRLGADDFLPIFIYCVVNSSLTKPFSLVALLNGVCAACKKVGEVGYYLATFEASVEAIAAMETKGLRGATTVLSAAAPPPNHWEICPMAARGPPPQGQARRREGRGQGRRLGCWSS